MQPSPSRQMKRQQTASLLSLLYKGAIAGTIALFFNFFLRLGNLAPFPPEAGIESFLKIIPESIQEPAVQQLGELAGQLGLFIATIVAIVVYGVLAAIFWRFFYPWIKSTGKFSRLEAFLAFSIFPWILFGAILLPILGVSTFGFTSISATSQSTWEYPLSLLFVQLIFSLLLFYEFKSAGLLSISVMRTTGASAVVRPSEVSADMKRIEDPQLASRRSFVEKGIVIGGAVALAALNIDALIGSSLFSGGTQSQTTQNLPIDLKDAPQIFQDPRLASLVQNEVTPNGAFYRVAIDLFDPSVNGSTWNLDVEGVGGTQKKSYTLASFQNSFTPVTQYNTFECVSNLINGNLVGNAKWTGVRISDLLSDAGISASGDTSKYVLVFYSVDGYSVGIPYSKAMMQDSILAYMMNDATLPQRHGYPLRAVIPGLYGMMSAKWINKIQLVDTPYSGYWQTRGWSPTGVVQTVAFVMIPGNGDSPSLSSNNGSIILGGVAYAGNREISKVEISTDQGNTWQEATLKPAISNDTWRLWAYDWHPSKTGGYNIYARATDGSGALQSANPTDTFPNGATGYAIISVNVTN